MDIFYLRRQNLYMVLVQKLAEKIWEIVESGELRKLNELSDQEEVKALRLFTGKETKYHM